MEHLKTATAALKALLELGYPLELQRVVDYLENLDSKDELIQFDDEDALSSFLQKYPSMFWVEGSKVFPAQMKPKGKLKSSPQTQSQSQQSHSKVQTVSDSNDKARQQEQKVSKVEKDKKKSRVIGADDSIDQTARLEEDGIRAITEVLKREGPMRLKALLRSVHVLPSEVRSFIGKDKESVIEFILEHPDIFLIDDDDIVFHESTVHKEAAQQFKSILQSKGKLPVDKLAGHISGFKHKTEILWFIGGSPSDVETFLRGYPNTFRVDDRGTVSLINTKTKQPASASACSGGKSKTTSNTTKVAVKLKVPHAMSEQPMMNKQNKLLQEGVKHFKDVLQMKASLPIERLFGHVNQCRNEVKQAIGTTENEVKEFLNNYPEVFSISKKGNVQLVSSKAKQQQVDQGKDKVMAAKSISTIKCSTKPTSVPSGVTNSLQEAKLENTTKKTVDYFKAILSKKGPSTIHVLSTYFGQCDKDIRMHVGSTKEGLTKFLKEHPQMFKIDGHQIVHLNDKTSSNDLCSPCRDGGIANQSDSRQNVAGNLIDVCKQKPTVETTSEHRYDQTFKIDHASERISLKEANNVQETEPDVLPNSADGIQQKQSTQLTVKEEVKRTDCPIDKTGINTDVSEAEDNCMLQLVPTSDAADRDTAEVGIDDVSDPSSVPCFSNSKEDSDVECEVPDGAHNVEALLEEGVAHFMKVLEKKGSSMPLGTVHEHMSQCREEVRKAISGGPEKTRALFLRFPNHFYIDAHNDVHLVSQLSQEFINAVSAALERKGPLHLGELLSHLHSYEPKTWWSFFGRNNARTSLEQHPNIFIDKDNIVYLVSAIKNEGVQHFKDVLELKGSLHIKSLCGHSGQYKYVDAMLKVIGGSPSSLMDFLKGFPEMFSIDEGGMVHLTSATVTQEQESKLGKENRADAVEEETDQKIPDPVPVNLYQLQENEREDSKCTPSTAPVQASEKPSGQTDKEDILQRGLKLVKDLLQSEGSMPVQKILEYVSQCRKKLKKAVGTKKAKIKTFLNQYPDVFHIDHKDIVHLVIDRANEQQGVQHTTNQTELKALAHLKEVLSRQGPSTTQTISSCYHSCDKDIQVHVVGKKGLRKFFMEYPLTFKVDGNKVMHLNNNRSFDMITNDNGMATSSPCAEEDAQSKKSDMSNNIFDKCVMAVKDILSDKQSLPLAQLFKELAAMFPQETFKMKDLRLYLKKCPGVFHVNNKDVVEVTPPTNVLVTVQEVADRRCRATLEDGSKVDVFLALYRERMGVDCNSLKHHLSPGDILLVDTERDQPACSMMWVANNIAAVFKSPLDIDVVKHGLKLDMPTPFLPATPTERSPSEICDVIVKLVASSLEVISPLKVDVLSSWMKFLNQDAIMYLKEKGGLLQFLQSQPLMFQVQDGCVTLLAGKGEADKENSQCLASPEAKCVIGEVKTVGNNTAILVLPSRMEATCELNLLTNHSNSTPPLTTGDSVVAYVVPCPGQGTICRQVTQVKHIIAKAAPKQIQDGRAVVTCSCPHLKEALQQCTKNNDVDALLAWHQILRCKTSISYKEIQGYLQELTKQVRKYTIQKGGPFGFLEQYPTLFHVDRLKVEVSLAQCKQNRSMLDPLNNAFINGGRSEQQQDQDQGLGSLKVQSDGKEKSETADSGVTICTKGNTAGQNQKEQKMSNGTCTSDRYVTVVKNVLSVKENLSILQLVDVLQAMFPKDTFDETSIRLFLKKHPDVFQINLLGVVKEIPPMNALVIVDIVSRNSCHATLEDGSRVYVPIALYRERMAVDCDSLKDHLSYGDVLLVDTERGKRWSSLKWSGKNITAVFKSCRSQSTHAGVQRGNLQTPMPFLPATTIERSPSEISDAITRHIAFCLDVRSPLKLESLSWEMKDLNHDALVYLRAQKGLLSFLQTQPQKFLVEDGNVSLVGKQPITHGPHNVSRSRDTAGHFPQEGNTMGDTFADIGMSMYSEDISTPVAKSTEMEPSNGGTNDHDQSTPCKAKCVIGEVKAIDSSMAHLQLPKGQDADLNLTSVQESISTSCLSVGDCVVAYVVPDPDQSEIPWVVSKVKHVMGKAAPAQVHANTATATCGSHLLKEVLQQCVLEEEVDTVLNWHRLLSKKTKVLFEELQEVKGCLKKLSKKARMHTLEIGTPHEFLEQYPTLFHVDRAMREISLVECSPVSRAVFSGGVKRVRTPPVQMEGNPQPVTEKPAVGMKSQSSVATTDQDAVAFFRSKVLEKGQVSIQVLSSSFGSCPRAIRRHVGSSQKGLVKFLRDHPDTFSLDEDEMVCRVKDTLQTAKEQEKTDQIAHADTGSAVLLEENELPTNPQEDRNDGSMQNVSSSSCHQLFNPTVSHDKHNVDEIDEVENQEEPDEEVDPVDVKRETSELIFDLVQRCSEISFSSLQGYINLLGEDKQECIKDKGGLLSFLEHDQRFQIDHVSEGISLKRVQETEPDSNYADNEQEHQSTEAMIVKGEVKKTDISIDEPSMNTGSSDTLQQKNQYIPIREHGDDTGTSLLTNSIRTEDKHDDVDVSTVVTPSELVTSETNVDIAVSPVQTLRTLPGPVLNHQEQASCDSSTAVPTATVHPMSVSNDSSRSREVSGTKNGPDSRPVGAFSHGDQSTDSRLNTIAVQTEETGTVAQVSQSSTAEDTDALLPSSAERSADSSQGTQDQTQARSTSVPVQGRPLHLLVGENGTRVWVNSGQQDMQPLAVFPTEGVVPVANPPGLPDDFTSLLPMFKDNLRPIQDSLVEVEMDIGRIPIARYYSPESPVLAAIRLSEQTLTRETLETILFALPLERSAIGQGRVLLTGSLHWISTLKNSLGEVVGLTLRRGQAVPGCLDLLWDVVTSGTSTLIVGRPCSGKTTLLREWAQVLSDVCYRRVIVVDTMNEIAGGDDIPHPGIGGARRVQVHNRCEQVSQLQTAARNHSPDCIIVDEVQTQEEVTALQAIRLTGIQVVAGVCAGCLTDLLHNSVMRGLLGLSDPPSSTSAPLGVSQQPLTFPQTLPVFQAAVTIHNRDTVLVYSDIASFVRVWLLEGRFPLAQHRQRVV